MPAALSPLARLTDSLREIASALVSPNATALLAAEPVLAQVIDELRAVRSIDPEDRAAIFAELQSARVELQRCRTLGANARDLVNAMLALHGHHQYDNLGVATSTPVPNGGRMKARL